MYRRDCLALEESFVVVLVVELFLGVVLLAREEVVAQGDAEGALLAGDAVPAMLVKDVVVEDAAVVFGGGEGEDAHQTYHELFLLVVDHEVLCVLGRVDEAAAEHLIRYALVVLSSPAALADVHGPGQRHVVVVVGADDVAFLLLPPVAALELYRQQVVAEGPDGQRALEAIVEQVVAVLVPSHDDAFVINRLPLVVGTEVIVNLSDISGQVHVEPGQVERVGEAEVLVECALQPGISRVDESGYGHGAVVAQAGDVRRDGRHLAKQSQGAVLHVVGEQGFGREVELVVVGVVVARVDIGGSETHAVAYLGQLAVELCVGIVPVVGGVVFVFLVVGEHVADAVVRLGQRGFVSEGELRAAPVFGIGSLTDERVFVVVLPHVVIEGLLRPGVLNVVYVLAVVEKGTHGVECDFVAPGQLAVEVEVEGRREAILPLPLVLCAVVPQRVAFGVDGHVAVPEPREDCRCELRLEVEAVATGVEVLQVEVVVGIAEVVGTTVVVGGPFVAVFEGVDILFVAVRRVAQFEAVVKRELMRAVVVLGIDVCVIESRLRTLHHVEAGGIAVLGGTGVDVEYGAGIGVAGRGHHIVVDVADVLRLQGLEVVVAGLNAVDENRQRLAREGGEVAAEDIDTQSGERGDQLLTLACGLDLLFGEGVDIAVLALHLSATFHGHRLQAVGIGAHRQHADLRCADVAYHAAVADTGEADEHVGGSAGDDEFARRRRHAAIDECRVTRTEYGDIDKLHRPAFLIDDAPCEFAVFLLCALHENHVGQRVPLVVLSTADHLHADGVEADELVDGVGHALAAHVSGDLEVLKVVVGEVDDVMLGDSAQIAQGVGHGGTVERVGDGLCAEPCSHQNEYSKK